MTDNARAGDRAAERAAITARLDGCEHENIARSGGAWVCLRCDQEFIPMLTEPVRPRANSQNGRLSGHQDW